MTAKFSHSLDDPFRVFAYIFFSWGIRNTSIATKSAAVPIFNASSMRLFLDSLGSI